ncbi:UNVERIFIED_CONTAM: 8-hydroxygeraniol dehydrogenase [Sesamum radiatum]|uniref:8-hydroxygeraniol dehydrogenase n=1 Tax=Sesamum radiatum TaxID=300843 RepID=A0AAW2PYR0_SESRA
MNGVSPITDGAGHEIVGVVTEVGPRSRNLKSGTKSGVGCVVNSCRKCDQCANDLENYCPKPIFTYNTILPDGTVTYGGYSDIMGVDEDFAIRCPRISLWIRGSVALRGDHHLQSVEILRLDKPASNWRCRDGGRRLGLERDYQHCFAQHPIQPLLSLLRPHGKMIMVGRRRSRLSCRVFLIMRRKTVREHDRRAERDAGDD